MRHRAIVAETMRSGRRGLLAGAAAMALPGLACAQAAGDYPTRPIRVVLGFAAGGLADITMRLVGEALSQRIGQPVVVDNRPGGAGTPAAMAAASATPDGHALAMLSTGNAVNRTLLRNLPYDPVADFAPVCTLVTFDLLLLAAPASPLRGLPDLRAARGDLTIGTISPGSTQNLTGQWLRVAIGGEATVVPYRSSAEVLTAVQRGDVQVGVESFAAARSLLDAGQLRAIASTGERRSSLLPELPTLRESGLPDVAVVGWNAVFAPARVPRPVIALLSGHLQAVLAAPETRSRLLGLGVEPTPETPDALGARLRQDVATWAGVIERANIQRQ